MVSVLWNVFPRLMEQNINGLLDGAQPTALRALQIYRVFRTQGLWKGDVGSFSRSLEDFYGRPRSERQKSDFDRHLYHPMDYETYALFSLDFRTAAIADRSIESLASWAHNLIRVAKRATSPAVSLEVIEKALRRVTTPTRTEKAQNITFRDFVSVWKSTVFKLFGSGEDQEFAEIVKELEWLDAKLEEEAALPPERVSIAPVYLTQTETEWTVAVRNAAYEGRVAPEFPLSRAPEKQVLAELERVVALYKLSLVSRKPEIAKNRERIRLTLLDRCNTLLGNKAKLVG